MVIEETKSVGVRRRTEAGVCVLKKRLELRKLKKKFTERRRDRKGTGRNWLSQWNEMDRAAGGGIKG